MLERRRPALDSPVYATGRAALRPAVNCCLRHRTPSAQPPFPVYANASCHRLPLETMVKGPVLHPRACPCLLSDHFLLPSCLLPLL